MAAIRLHKRSFAHVGPGRVPIETGKLYDPITFRVFHPQTFYSAARGAQVSKKGLPSVPRPSQKAVLFRFAEEAGTYVTTTTRSRNSETADELGAAAVFTCIVGHGQTIAQEGNS